MTNNKFNSSNRKHICLITYHGYPGANIPIGGVPDTGGQIIYVNAYARALGRLGYKVTIFTRGGFPFFYRKIIREGVEYLSDYARYIYVPSGPENYIPKEDIGNILDEAVEWIYLYICKEAKRKKVKPHDYFWFINSHYWDAAVLGDKLIQRWQNDLFLEKISKLNFHPAVIKDYTKERHKLNLVNNIQYFIGEIFFMHVKETLCSQLPDNFNILNFKQSLIKGLSAITKENRVSTEKVINKILRESKKVIPSAVYTFLVERIGHYIINKKLSNINRELTIINKHAWTPHSLGALKERNYFGKEPETVWKLKFLERTGNEKDVLNRIPVIAATSQEIISVSCNYYNYPLKKIVYFPPGSDEKKFKPRTKEQCRKAWKFLSKLSGYTEKELMGKRIIFETSRMDNTKRKDLLIKAFKLIVNEYDDLLLVIGGGPENNVFTNLKKQINKLNLTKKVFVTGFIPEELIGEFFAMPTIFVSASEMEGFGISVLNAISSRIPLVSSNLIPLTVQYLQTCSLIVNAGDTNGFAQSIKKYLDNQKLMKAYTEKAFTIAQDFKWGKLTKTFISELRRLKIV